MTAVLRRLQGFLVCETSCYRGIHTTCYAGFRNVYYQPYCYRTPKLADWHDEPELELFR